MTHCETNVNSCDQIYDVQRRDLRTTRHVYGPPDSSVRHLEIFLGPLPVRSAGLEIYLVCGSKSDHRTGYLELHLYTIADELDKMKIKNTCIKKAIAKDSMSLVMKFDDSYSQK